MNISSNHTQRFFESINKVGDYNFTPTTKLLERKIKKISSDMLIAGVSFNEESVPELSMTDIQVGYLIAKIGPMNMAQIINSIKLRQIKLENPALPMEPTIVNTNAILARLINKGVVCQMTTKGEKEQIFYFVSNQGRKLLNRANDNKNLKDLEFSSLLNEKEVLAEAAASYLTLSMINKNYKIKENKIVKVRVGTERFCNILEKDKTLVGIDGLYFYIDRTLTSDEEFLTEQKQKIKKICDYAYRENNKVILMCNSANDIRIFFDIFLSNICNEQTKNICKSVYFTSVECIKENIELSDAFARFDVEYVENKWCVNGNCIFDFEF